MCVCDTTKQPQNIIANDTSTQHTARTESETKKLKFHNRLSVFVPCFFLSFFKSAAFIDSVLQSQTDTQTNKQTNKHLTHKTTQVQ